MIATEPTTIRHQIGECPACRSGLWAYLQVVTEVGTPTVDREGKARVYATPRFVAMTLEHFCERNEEGEWTYPRTPTPAETTGGAR